MLLPHQAGGGARLTTGAPDTILPHKSAIYRQADWQSAKSESALPHSQRCDSKFAELHCAMIALNDERPGLRFIRVDRDRGQTFHFLIVDDRHPVQRDRQTIAHQRNIGSLPLARRLAGIRRRRDAADPRVRRLLGCGALELRMAGATGRTAGSRVMSLDVEVRHAPVAQDQIHLAVVVRVEERRH